LNDVLVTVLSRCAFSTD